VCAQSSPDEASNENLAIASSVLLNTVQHGGHPYIQSVYIYVLSGSDGGTKEEGFEVCGGSTSAEDPIVQEG
jgi:hypothetical protein